MYGFLLTLIILDGLLLITVVLLQAGKGGGLAAMGGGAAATEGVLGGRQATTMLTRATWVTGSLFMVLALVLAIMSSRSAAPDSILRTDQTQTAPAAQPILPTTGAEAAPGTGGDAAGTTGGDDSGN